MSSRSVRLQLQGTSRLASALLLISALTPVAALAQDAPFTSPYDFVSARWCTTNDDSLSHVIYGFATPSDPPSSTSPSPDDRTDEAAAGFADGVAIEDRCFFARPDDDAWEDQLGFARAGETYQLDLFFATNHVGTQILGFSFEFDVEGANILDFQWQEIYRFSPLMYPDYAITNPCTPYPDCFALNGFPEGASLSNPNWKALARSVVAGLNFEGEAEYRLDTISDGSGLLESQADVGGKNRSYDSGLSFDIWGRPRPYLEQAEMRVASMWFRVNEGVAAGSTTLVSPGLLELGEAISNGLGESINSQGPWQEALPWLSASITVGAPSPGFDEDGQVLEAPEPASAWLRIAGAIGLLYLARRRAPALRTNN
jgi:hypothetical protein